MTNDRQRAGWNQSRLPNYLSIHCILGDIRLWVGDPSTSCCRLSPPRAHLTHPRISPLRLRVTSCLVTVECTFERSYLTQSVDKVVLQKSNPPPIRQPILYYYCHRQKVDRFVWESTIAKTNL